MLAKLSVDQILIKARSHAHNGEVEEAQSLYQDVLKAKKELIKQELAVLNKPKQNNAMQSLPKEVLDQLANTYNQGRFLAVVEKTQTLIEQYPHAFILWNLLGASASQIGMLDQAIYAYKKAISIKPDYADAYCNMSVALQNQGKPDEAIEACNKAISLKPDYVVAYSNMGNAFQNQGKLDEAIKAYNKAISLKSDYPDAYYNLGIALQDQGKLDEAIEAYNTALLFKPDYVLAYNNKGKILKYQGNLDKAIDAYRKSISFKPDYAEAHHNLSFALLNKGRLKEALDEYEWRWRTSKYVTQIREFSQPLWDGKKSLKGKRILLWCEQGIGDTIIWSSCLPLLTSQADHCILECQEKLVPLFKRSFTNVEIKVENRSQDLERDDFDFHLPMGSLYRHFMEEIKRNAKAAPFLISDPARVKFWRKRLNSLGNGPYIGISWKSSNMAPTRLPNYAPISEWSPLLKLPNVTFINLQSKDFADDLTKIQDQLGVTIHNFNDLDHHNNLLDVAALCSELDFVVSIQNSVPLISAGVGTSTKLASWQHSPWNNVLHKPVGPLVSKFERDTFEPWDRVFNLITKDILKLTKNRLSQ